MPLKFLGLLMTMPELRYLPEEPLLVVNGAYPLVITRSLVQIHTVTDGMELLQHSLWEVT